MRIFSQLMMRFKMLFSRGRAGSELNAELAYHLDQQIAENIAAGMSPAAARQAALRLFGNPEQLREQARETWSFRWAELAFADLRHGVRRLARTPGFSLLAILVMSLGIGANVALFTVVKSVLLNPLPFRDQHRLVRMFEADARGAFLYNSVAGGCYAAWQAQSHSFDGMALKRSIDYDLANAPTAGGAQLPEVVSAEMGTWNLFPMLGIRPELGRSFLPADDVPEAEATVVLTHGLWERRFGGDPSVIGKTILLDARKYTIIGVFPDWFTYPDAKVQLWTALGHERSRAGMQMFDTHNFDAIGRLKPGVSLTQANAELSAIQRNIRKMNPEGPINDATSLLPMLEAETTQVKTGLYTLLAATGCLLLIACLNIANLLVARSAARRRETAIRTALGSSRARLIREQITESILLSCAGGVAGFALAALALKWLVSVRQDIPRADSIHIDLSIILIATGLTLLSGLLAGLIPALSTSDRQILRALHESSRSTTGGRSGLRLRRVLLSLQVGLTVVLLVGSGLLIKSYRQLRSVNIGCATEGVLTMRYKLPKGSYNSAQKISNFDQQLLSRVRALPGLQAAALVTQVPGDGPNGDDVFRIPEHPPLPQGKVLVADTLFADPGYFSAMQIPLLHGTIFRTAQPGDPVQQVVVNQQLVRVNFPGEDPIGKHIVSGVTDDHKTYEVAGVVGDTLEDVSKAPRPTIYFPLLMGTQRTTVLTLRAAPGHDPATLALPAQRAIASLDADLPVSRVLTMNQIVGESTIDASFDATLLLGFAIISLLLAAVGLFGVLSYLVTQRTTEIGVRLALGAQRNQVLALMLKDGLRPAVIGLVLGLIASVGAAKLIQSLLYATTGVDPEVFAIVSGALLLSAVLACLLPAWRASRLEPVEALRTE